MADDQQPDELLIHVIVRDLKGPDAYAYTDTSGESICVVDRSFLRNDPAARLNAFKAFISLAN